MVYSQKYNLLGKHISHKYSYAAFRIMIEGDGVRKTYVVDGEHWRLSIATFLQN